MRAADLLIRCLENEGVRHIFGVPGEENLDVMDALSDSPIRFIATRHEQGAAFMADVQGRLTGHAGVCLSTLGPGATNLLTGVADAYLDRAPLVALTAQVSLDRMHKESHQSIDVRSMFRSVTKWNAEITRPHILPEAVRKAFKVAETEKPGATHLELPEDVAAQRLTDDGSFEPLPVQHPVLPEPVQPQVARAARVIAKAVRPVLLAGNGIVRGAATEAVREFARRLNIPVVHTFMSKGILPDADPLSLYTIGLQMQDHSARLLAASDLVITVGYDPVEYAPSLWNPDRRKPIVHVDVTPAEVDAHYVIEVGVIGNIALSMEAIGRCVDPQGTEWARHCRHTIQRAFEEDYAASPGWPLRPQHVIRELRAALAPDDLVVCDVGAHKLWMARMFPCELPNTCLISNGFAAMGIGLPGAIVAKLLYPQRQVVTVTGDGGFLMNSQELETAVRLNLPVAILVWRDNGYGVIRWKQQVRFHRAFGVEFTNPDLVAYAESFGAAGFRVEGPSELSAVMKAALACGKPAVIDCPVDYSENMRLSERLHSLS
jgi:acetolactate synthase-1/2/3 large subunit